MRVTQFGFAVNYSAITYLCQEISVTFILSARSKRSNDNLDNESALTFDLVDICMYNVDAMDLPFQFLTAKFLILL